MNDDWNLELEDAGWKKISSTVWKSPWGHIYRGPSFAWNVMQSVKIWGLKRCTDCGEVASAGGTVKHRDSCTKGDLAIELLQQGIVL